MSDLGVYRKPWWFWRRPRTYFTWPTQVALDASSPAAVRNALASTDVNYTPPDACGIVAYCHGDANNGSLDETLNVSSTGGLTWHLARRANGATDGNASTVEVWWAYAATSPGAITISLTDNKGAVDKSLFVRGFTATDPAVIGATAASTTATATYTSTVAGSWGWSAGLGGNAGSLAAAANCALADATAVAGFDGGDTVWTTQRLGLTPTASSSVVVGTDGALSTYVHHVAVEIIPVATAAASVPAPSWRTIFTRDPGETWWLQRDRRNALLVATVANPLPSPLDTAWQVDGRYGHLYNDTATRDRRAYFTQRTYISTPGLLGTAELENELLGGADLTRHAAVFADRRLVPTQRTYPNLTLLAPATAVGYVKALDPADYTDRRVAGQQRAYVDPNLLTTALLEAPLLGGADQARHVLTIADRRQVPAQRVYGYDPNLLASAELENELLGGAGTAAHQAWYTDRRVAPLQRSVLADLSGVAPATDPLTVAWGVGGTYWHMYNSIRIDRRGMVAQRAVFVLPSPGLLENELLGGGDTLRYLTWYVDRRLVPQQHPGPYPPPSSALLEGPLLGGADDRTRHLAWYVDRRCVPAQPQRLADSSLLIVADPTALAFGAGGNQWHVYHPRRPVRSTWPYWLVYLLPGGAPVNADSLPDVIGVVGVAMVTTRGSAGSVTASRTGATSATGVPGAATVTGTTSEEEVR